MRAFTFREFIDRSPRQVWDTLVDLDAAPMWRPLTKTWIGRSAPLVLSGAGADERLCARLRVDRLDGDLVGAAEAIASSTRGLR